MRTLVENCGRRCRTGRRCRSRYGLLGLESARRQPRRSSTASSRRPRADVKIERDGLGIPTIRASNRKDLAFATGFVHGQDRFFQMDFCGGIRPANWRTVGPAGAPGRRRVRVNRFRDVARGV